MRYFMVSDRGNLLEIIEAANLRLAIDKFNEIRPYYDGIVFIDSDLDELDESED